jgi:DNA-binding MarR family transcriptional regulator
VAAGGQISKQRANDLLRDLERLGDLELEPDPTDSRARIIRLTKRGADVYAITSAIQSEIEQDWAESIGPAEVERVREGLRRVVEEGPSSAAARRRLRRDPER